MPSNLRVLELIAAPLYWELLEYTSCFFRNGLDESLNWLLVLGLIRTESDLVLFATTAATFEK